MSTINPMELQNVLYSGAKLFLRGDYIEMQTSLLSWEEKR